MSRFDVTPFGPCHHDGALRLSCPLEEILHELGECNCILATRKARYYSFLDHADIFGCVAARYEDREEHAVS